MFNYDRPLAISAPEGTGPIFEYLFKFVEYCNVMLNYITPDQIAEFDVLIRSFAENSQKSASYPINSGSTGGKISVRRHMGLVFLEIGEMTGVPSGDTTLTILTPDCRPLQDEVCDYTTPDGKAFRLTVTSSGKVIIHSYSVSTLSAVDSHIRLVYPASI